MIALLASTALAAPFGFASPTPNAPWVELDPTCSNVPEARGIVASPALPHKTLFPRGRACVATTTAELQAHVISCPYDDIVIAPGRYTADGLQGNFLSLPQARRLWSLDSTWTVLEFGISLGFHAGSEIHGLQIDLDDATHAVPVGNGTTAATAAILFWDGPKGQGGNVVIEDTTIRGGDDVWHGILGSMADSVQIGRVGVEGFRRFGINLYQDDPVTTPAWVHDVVVRDIGDPAWQTEPVCTLKNPTPGCYSPGTSEHGVWIGASATVERVQVRDVWWAGVITANCGATCDEPLTGVHFRDLDIDRIGVGDGLAGPGAGVAFERVTHDTDVERFCIGPDTERGLHAEWDHNLGEGAAHLSITNGVIASDTVGISLGSGTIHTTVDDVQVLDASWAGVAMECCGSANPDTCDTTWIGAGVDVQGPAVEACGFPGGGYGGVCSCL